MTGPYNTEALRWRALTIRDPNANGHFVYAVKTTLCYCRPTCPARLARRANVAFYNTWAQAEAAGFHACKRCKPSEPIQEQPAERAVAKVCALIEEALKGEGRKSVKLQDLAKTVGLTPRYFHKVFKDKMGMTPKEWSKMRGANGASLGNAMVVGEGCAPKGANGELEGQDGGGDLDFDDLVDLDGAFLLTPENSLSETTFTPLTEDLPTPNFASVLQGNETVAIADTEPKTAFDLPRQNFPITTNKITLGASMPQAVTDFDFELDLTQILDATVPTPAIPNAMGHAFDMDSWNVAYQDFVWGNE
ncbi:uncharacterized protein EI97DRAFT_23163 [Westerdykella ornata]|uniref:HTH araC/xylS-type domain-containing protein n=1 Tax=Westerdykella ornata TaxID=318751 RepID=A0A6A6JYE3_WESOR|nr:uncharacterized protein EI97DRAFT_23163 [Westerdykella ornata]KAF2281215.1 hypothetical protein EI97DRAFT_23163 [Westerdykella ornata]